MNVHRSMIVQAYDTCLVTESREDDVMLATTPFYTAGGMIRTISWMFMGQTLIIHPRFDPDHVIHDIEHRRATFTTFIPTMLQRVLARLRGGPGARHVEPAPDQLRLGSVGPDLARRADGLLGCQLQQRYGLTEAGGQVTILQPWDHDRMFTDKPWLVGSCGRETVHAEITIVDDDGNELPPGEVGEIRIVGEATAAGYWNRPEETAATFRPDGLYSGDVGRLDDEGYLYIVSRKTDMIISGGFNVYPAEIERVHRRPSRRRTGRRHRRGRPRVGRDAGGHDRAQGRRSAPTSSRRACGRCAGASWPATSSPAGSSSAPRCRSARLGRSSSAS